MSKIKIPGMTESLSNALNDKITSLEAENKYFDDFFDSIGSNSSVSDVSTEEGENKTDMRQIGVGIPRWYGLNNTFIANPSNVGIGILARMIETDDTVMAAVQFKAMMMLSKIGEYQHEKPEIAEFVRTFLKKMYGPTWTEALEAMASKGGYGFSVSEVIWGLNNHNQKVPMKIKTYHPSTICFEVDAWGEITEWGIVQFIFRMLR